MKNKGFSVRHYLAASVFQTTIVKYKAFGLIINNELSFNRPLFTQILVGVLFVALLHLYSSLSKVSISTGNAILSCILICNIFCFSIGLSTPLLHTSRFWIIKEQHTFWEVLSNLKLNGEMQIYYIIISFSLFIPAVKLMAISYNIFLSKQASKKNIVLSFLSKWAMLDVMVVGVIIGTMRSNNGFAEIARGIGMKYFIASVFLSLIISAILPYTQNSKKTVM